MILLLTLFFLADSGVIVADEATVSATVLLKNNCQFQGTDGVSLLLGDLDPSMGGDVEKTVTLQFRCAGSAPQVSFALSHDDGLHGMGNGVLRMQHEALPGAYLPYSLSLSPERGTVPKNDAVTLSVTGRVKGMDYQDAAMGGYADTVVITLLP